jgi:hypothetical protein
MSVFREEKEFKRMIFNINSDVAEAIELLKDKAKNYGKKLDVDTTVNKALAKFIKKAEKKIEEMQEEAAKARKKAGKPGGLAVESGPEPAADEFGQPEAQARE